MTSTLRYPVVYAADILPEPEDQTVRPRSEPPRQVLDFLRTSQRLMGLLEEEIDLLRVMSPTEMQDIQQDKIVLAALYESQLKQLTNQPALFEQLSHEHRDQVNQAMREFRQALNDNEQALRASRHVTETLIQELAFAVARQEYEDQGYLASGLRAERQSRANAAVAVDKRL